MYSPHGLGASGGLVGANPASLAYREGQIQNAIRFLQNTAVSRLTPQLRIRFLEEKVRLPDGTPVCTLEPHKLNNLLKFGWINVVRFNTPPTHSILPHFTPRHL